MSVVKELFRIPAAIGMPAPDARIFYTVDNGNGLVVIGFDRKPSPLLIPSFAFWQLTNLSITRYSNSTMRRSPFTMTVFFIIRSILVVYCMTNITSFFGTRKSIGRYYRIYFQLFRIALVHVRRDPSAARPPRKSARI